MIRAMPDNQAPAPLPVPPGLCGECAYAARNATRRGTTYLRCTRAAWDDRLVRYPRLPVSVCVGFRATEPDRRGGPDQVGR
jgi:hypothetical protein